MDLSKPIREMTKLWQCAVALVDEIQKEVGSKDSGENCRRIRLKFNHVVSNMTCVRDIVAMLLEKDMITERERDDIFSLDSSPTRASEELLHIIMRKESEVFDSFLKALIDTKQHHIYKLMISEVEDCLPTIHSDIIRRNYKWLVEKLDPSNGLVCFLYQKQVLTIRELESIDSETDTFKKNDKLLSLISRKCSENFEVFLLGLIDTKQMHVYARFKQSPPPLIPSTERPNKTDKHPGVSTPLAKRAFSVPGSTISPDPPPPPIPPTREKSTFQIKSVTQTILHIRETRRSICGVRKRLTQLSDQHQSEISLKVIAIRHARSYATSNVLDSYLLNALKEFDRLKKEAQQIDQEKSEDKQFMVEFFQRELTHKDEEITKLKAEVLCKSMEITNTRSKTEKELGLQRLIEEVTIQREVIEKERTRSYTIKQKNRQLIKEKAALEEYIRQLKAEVTDQKDVTKQLTEKRSMITKDSTEQNANGDFEYKENWKLLKKIEKNTNSKADGLSRLAILDSDLYIVPLEGHDMEVYDLFTLSIKNKLSLENVESVEDIGSCDRNKCLYIANWIKEKKVEEILKVDRSGVVLKRWLTLEDQGRLSIASDANIILTVCSKNKLTEYSSDGELQRTIRLPSDITHPQHAIKLTNGQFVVSYGSGVDCETIHGVCIVDVQGNVLKSFYPQKGSSVGAMNHPMYLTIDRKGCILVADLNNSRVLLLSATLEFLREIVTEKDGLRHPRRICLDESNGRLIVACGSCRPNQTDSDVGQVLLFEVEER